MLQIRTSKEFQTTERKTKNGIQKAKEKLYLK